MPLHLSHLGAIAGASLMLAVVLSPARAETWNTQGSSRVDAVVARFLIPHASAGAVPPSISLAIGIDGRLVMAKAYGEARPAKLASERTVYQIGSLTKQFTAAAVLRLIEEKASCPISGAPLTLDTPMADIFDNVDHWRSADEPTITVRSLLTMTSNLPNFTRRPPTDTDPWGSVPASRLLAEVKKMSPHGWPNTFEYSNTSYFLLAQIIAAVHPAHPEHGSYREYIRAVTIDKAHLDETGFSGDDALAPELAEPHYQRQPAFTKPDWLTGSGDMQSTAVDLLAWNRSLVAGEIIGPDSLAAMFSDGARVGPTTYYGMGWFVEHTDRWDRFSHSGSVPGFTSYNSIRKRQDGSSWRSVTLLTNSDGVEGLDDLADKIFDIIGAE